jgi:hypothetical protein
VTQRSPRLGTKRWGALRPNQASTHLRKRITARRPVPWSGSRCARHDTGCQHAGLCQRRGRGQGVLGCGQPELARAFILQRKSYGVKANTQQRGTRLQDAARKDPSRRGYVLRALGCTQPRRAHTITCTDLTRPSGEHQRGVVGAGLTVALGCAVTATATSSLHNPTRHKGQPLEHKARHAHGARHGGASRGSPWFGQRNSNAATC